MNDPKLKFTNENSSNFVISGYGYSILIFPEKVLNGVIFSQSSFTSLNFFIFDGRKGN